MVSLLKTLTLATLMNNSLDSCLKTAIIRTPAVKYAIAWRALTAINIKLEFIGISLSPPKGGKHEDLSKINRVC